ncbi:hypothetical protein C4D60_Mb11t12570 [Musa balbisiana]|uniref:MSP domain-containing protein n=1 Tax=Musa balbisiana TaxID=52838 RepID=A0A4S8J626_MUSBA|nr:hypothetical protein C4D60_Mb11t12570 [Musa balbisiana]
MALAEVKAGTEGKGWGICRLPFFGGGGGGGGGGGDGGSSSNSSSTFILTHNHHYRSSGQGQTGQVEGGAAAVQAGRRSSGASSVSSVARSLLPTRRRLRLDPPTKLYFPYEPGKQVRSAVRIKNTSKSHVAFKFQTTAPKSCFMRPPGGILSPGESIIASGNFFFLLMLFLNDFSNGCNNQLISRMYFLKKTSTPVAVFKFVEQPENNEKPMDQKSKVKFKIVSLKVNGPMEYVPELFDEQKDQVAVEQILRVVFLDPDHPCPQMEKLKRQLAEAEAALEARKKPPEDTGPRIVGEGLVIDEWKERRERYLAQQQQVEGVDSVLKINLRRLLLRNHKSSYPSAAAALSSF